MSTLVQSVSALVVGGGGKRKWRESVKDGAIHPPSFAKSVRPEAWEALGYSRTFNHSGLAQVPEQAMAQAVLPQDIPLSSGVQGHEGQHDFCLSV